MWVQVVHGLPALLPAFHRVHWCRCAGFGGCPRFRGVFRPFVPAFCLPSCLAFGGLLANMPLFRILRGF